MKSKNGVELSMNLVIIAAIGLLVLVILAVLVINSASPNPKSPDNFTSENLTGANQITAVVHEPLYKELDENGSLRKEVYVLDENSTMKPILLCPENKTISYVTCDCAKNTSTPCMASCWECVNESPSIFKVADPLYYKNVTCLSYLPEENNSANELTVCSNDTNLPAFLVPLGNDTYAFKLPYRYIKEQAVWG